MAVGAFGQIIRHPAAAEPLDRLVPIPGPVPVSAPAPVLALHGVPAALAEPLGLLAGILGWQVHCRAPGLGGTAHLCLAPVPAASGESAEHGPALMAWSPDNNLNELICRQNASVLEQPPCINRLEQLLQTLGHHVMANVLPNAEPVAPIERGSPTKPGSRTARGGATGEWGRVDNEDCHARRT